MHTILPQRAPSPPPRRPPSDPRRDFYVWSMNQQYPSVLQKVASAFFNAQNPAETGAVSLRVLQGGPNTSSCAAPPPDRAAAAYALPAGQDSSFVNPSVWDCSELLQVSFPAGAAACGASFRQQDTWAQPYGAPRVAWPDAAAGKFFTVVIVDRDAVNRRSPLLMAAFSNIPGSLLQTGFNGTADQPGVTAWLPYVNPSPAVNSGCHRYYVVRAPSPPFLGERPSHTRNPTPAWLTHAMRRAAAARPRTGTSRLSPRPPPPGPDAPQLLYQQSLTSPPFLFVNFTNPACVHPVHPGQTAPAPGATRALFVVRASLFPASRRLRRAGRGASARLLAPLGLTPRPCVCPVIGRFRVNFNFPGWAKQQTLSLIAATFFQTQSAQNAGENLRDCQADQLLLAQPQPVPQPAPSQQPPAAPVRATPPPPPKASAGRAGARRGGAASALALGAAAAAALLGLA